MFPPKYFDKFSTDSGCSERLDAFILFFKNFLYHTYMSTRSPVLSTCPLHTNIIVQLTSSRVIDKMVVDEGRALQPCRYRLFTHMSCIILCPYSTQPCRGYTHVITNTGGNNY